MTENGKKRKVFPRYPIPKKEELRKILLRWAKDEDKSFETVVYLYLRGRAGDIVKSKEDIDDITKRETRRILKAEQCIKIALDMIESRTERERVRKDIYNRI